MEKKKEYKISSTLFYVSAVLFYLAALINIVGGNNTSIGIVWLCLGSTFLCLGSLFLNKSKENKKEELQFHSYIAMEYFDYKTKISLTNQQADGV